MKNKSVRLLKGWYSTYTVAAGLLPLPVKVLNGLIGGMVILSMASAYGWSYSVGESAKVVEARAQRDDAIALAQATMTSKEYHFVRDLYGAVGDKGQWKEAVQATLSQYPLVLESMQDGKNGSVVVQMIGDVASYMAFVTQLQKQYPFLVAMPKRIVAEDTVVHIEYELQALPLKGKAMYNKK